jgi:RimJ/RimL family protein N-acetyltransferase
MAAPLFGAAVDPGRLDACVATLLVLPAARGCLHVLDDAQGAGALCGFAAVVDGRLSYAVRADARRRGHATRLVAAACAARHDEPLRAAVLADNAASARLLERLGFRFAGRRGSRLFYDAPRSGHAVSST